MDKQVLLYAVIMLIGVLISSIAQVLLKKASQKKYDSVIKEYLNAPVMIAYAVFFGATLLSVFAYRVVPLSMGAILEATGYLYITFFSVAIFKEKIDRKKLIALGMILIGIVVYSVWG